MIQLLAIDMDGTCLNQHSKISAKTMTALKLAAKAGIQIVPATGRALSCLPYQLSNQKDLYRYLPFLFPLLQKLNNRFLHLSRRIILREILSQDIRGKHYPILNRLLLL